MALIPQAGAVRIGQNVTVRTAREQPSRTYRVDFAAGRIAGFIDGVEAVKQAILKILQTERFAYRIYSWNYGVELEAVLGKSVAVLESEIRRILSEALTEDRRITEITDVVVRRSGRRVAAVSFTAKTIFGEILMETEVNTGA